MPHPITVPPAGESITSATIAEWHKKDGETVNRGDLLVTLETDKVSNELEAEKDGTLEILVEVGEEVTIGTTIGNLLAKKQEEQKAPQNTPPAPEEPKKKAAEPTEIIDIKVPAAGESITSATIAQWHVENAGFVKKGQTLVSLETDKVSNELEAPESGFIDILVPTGEEVSIGTIVAKIAVGHQVKPSKPTPEPQVAQTAQEEVKPPSPKKDEEPKKTPPPPSKTPKVKEEKEPQIKNNERTKKTKMSPLRKKIATHLLNAQHNAAILTTFNEVDMSAVMKLRKEVQEEFIAKHGVKLGFMSFFVKAAVKALKEVPQINARIEGDYIIENLYYDTGVAIGTEKGLVVPVLRDPDEKSFAQIEQDIIDYAEKARSGKLKLRDLQGGVFTISNGGVYGSLLSTPILNPPQSGILGMHTIQQRPIALNGEVVIRPMMYLSLSYDHRIIDGKEAVTFLIKVKEAVENPAHMLLDI